MTTKGLSFGIVTYDALFKWVLDDSSIRPSFFHAFIPGIGIQSSERLDNHMNPLQELQNLRTFINGKNISSLIASIKENGNEVAVHVDKSYHEEATKFLKDVLLHFDDMCC